MKSVSWISAIKYLYKMVGNFKEIKLWGKKNRVCFNHKEVSGL